MPFPESHLLLTLHWKHSSWPLETGQCGIRFHTEGAGNLDATQARVDAAKPAVQTMWSALATKIPIQYGLDFLRLARIDSGGRYVLNTSSFDSRYSSGVLSGGGTSSTLPMQTACATTLLTNTPHGQATKGRIFLPPISANCGLDGLWSASDVNARSSAIATMLTSLNTALNATAFVYSTGTTRRAAGLGRPVTGIATGMRPDVQRRRAKGVTDSGGTRSSVTIGGDPGQVVGLGV